MQYFLSVIVNSIAAFFVCVATVLFLRCFYDTAFFWGKKKVLLFLLVTIIRAAAFLMFPDYYNLINWIFMIPYCFVASYDYGGKMTTGIWRYFKYLMFIQMLVNIYCILAAVCTSQYFGENINVIYNEYMSNNEYVPNAETLYQLLNGERLIIDIIGAVFFVITFFLLYSVYKKGVVVHCGKREIWLIFAVWFLSYALLFIVMYGLMIDEYVYIRYVLAFLGAVFSYLFPVFVYFTRYSEYYRTRTKIQEQHIHAELAHFQQYRQSQEETSRFRHDIRNNLLCINDMLQQGKSDNASEYLKDLLEIVENTSRKYVTGDDLLDSIVGVKAQIMEQYGIRFELDGVLAGGLTWKPMDICNVFANALDNAIEACQKVDPEKRQISLIIKSTPQFWFVTIANPVAEAVDTSKLFQRNGGYTSKSDSAKHGIGTYNMKNTVEAYGAMLKADCTNEIFKLEIMIDKSSPE